MSLGTGDGSEGNKEAGETNAADEASGPAGSIASLFAIGADEDDLNTTPPEVSYGITTDADALNALDPLSSRGETITYSSTGSVLTATAGGREVFTLTVNTDGSWSFDLKDQLDHVDDNMNDENWALQGSTATDGGIDLSKVLTATDFDGDTGLIDIFVFLR